MDLSDEQRVVLLETLWKIMSSFVDLGFGVDSVQQVLPALVHASLENGDDALEKTMAHQRFNAVANQTSEKEDHHE